MHQLLANDPTALFAQVALQEGLLIASAMFRYEDSMWFVTLLALNLIGGTTATSGRDNTAHLRVRAAATPKTAGKVNEQRTERGRLTLAQGKNSSYYILTSKNAAPAIRRGAEELQTYLEQLSGAKLPIRTDSAPLPQRAILVGPSRHLDRLKGAPTLKTLGAEEFVLRTVGPHLVILGGSPRGTMYGCTAFLERLGIRWYTPSVTKVPHLERITVSELNVREKPTFEYREPFFFEAQEREWAARNRINGHAIPLDEETGGKVTYHPFVHSLDELVPPSLYATHPEYFPLIKGKRTDGYVQRCLTNPEVLSLAIRKVREWIRDYPEATLYSVSQNDTGNWCECDQCQAMTAKYGAHSGLYLWFANQVAVAIEKEHPGKLIDTLAYQFTEEVPKGIIPHRNVRIRLCATACCEAHPYERCTFPVNVTFLKTLRSWNAITDHLFIWHYSANFAHYLMPFPNFAEFPTDLRLYQRTGVSGVFFQGAYAPGGGGADAELRSWIMAKLLWDVQLDSDALVTEWMRGVYGEAWQPMRRWFDLQHEKVRALDAHFGISDPPGKVPYLTADVITAGDQIFDQAERLAAANPVAADYVAKSRLWLRYVKLMQRPTNGPEFQSFLQDVRKRGITRLFEGQQELDAWEQSYLSRSLKGMGP